MAFSVCNFIKALMPRCSQNIMTKITAFSIFFFITNLALKTPKRVTRMPEWEGKILKLATFSSIFVAKKVEFKTPRQIYWHFHANKNASVKAFMKLASDRTRFVFQSFWCPTLNRYYN